MTARERAELRDRLVREKLRKRSGLFWYRRTERAEHELDRDYLRASAKMLP